MFIALTWLYFVSVDCGSDAQRCSSNDVCMFGDFFCDGTFDCDQGEDEDDCGRERIEFYITLVPYIITYKSCYSCLKFALQLKHADLLLVGLTATSSQFACRSGNFTHRYTPRAIDLTKRCDTVKDCTEGSDEWDCRK